jgi:hypothetical protein
MGQDFSCDKVLYETGEIATTFVFFLEYQGCDSFDQEILELFDQFLQSITRKVPRECCMAATKHEIGGTVFRDIHKSPTYGTGQDGHITLLFKFCTMSQINR